MNENAIVANNQVSAEIMEGVLIGGDLSKLSPAQRVVYYQAVCKSTGLNPLTRPFEYIILNGKLVLYAKRDAADQLRSLNSVSIERLERERMDDVYAVTAYAKLPNGRQDSSIGVVSIGNLKGDALANAMMKAETKAKRRVTLSICGLGWLDETEIETIPTARPVVVTETGEIIDSKVIDYSKLPVWVMETKSKEGVLYTELPTEDLVHRLNQMIDTVNKNGLTDEAKAKYADKIAAAKAVLEARK